ncbi:hypothetical protein K438DRAFT_2113411 [Mycena galopus ATCC 62051]|nr:hypothetical protein K438DRAFT_2113411 [Mycena galopus ATCC 62051]
MWSKGACSSQLIKIHTSSLELSAQKKSLRCSIEAGQAQSESLEETERSTKAVRSVEVSESQTATPAHQARKRLKLGLLTSKGWGVQRDEVTMSAGDYTKNHWDEFKQEHTDDTTSTELSFSAHVANRNSEQNDGVGVGLTQSHSRASRVRLIYIGATECTSRSLVRLIPINDLSAGLSAICRVLVADIAIYRPVELSMGTIKKCKAARLKLTKEVYNDSRPVPAWQSLYRTSDSPNCHLIIADVNRISNRILPDIGFCGERAAPPGGGRGREMEGQRGDRDQSTFYDRGSATLAWAYHGGQAGRKTIDGGSVALMIYFRSVAPRCALSRTNVDESHSASTGVGLSEFHSH